MKSILRIVRGFNIRWGRVRETCEHPLKRMGAAMKARVSLFGKSVGIEGADEGLLKRILHGLNGRR